LEPDRFGCWVRAEDACVEGFESAGAWGDQEQAEAECDDDFGLGFEGHLDAPD
jgi:hypothetical protein